MSGLPTAAVVREDHGAAGRKFDAMWFSRFPGVGARGPGGGPRVHCPVGSISTSAEDLPWYLRRSPPPRVSSDRPRVEVGTRVAG